MKQGVYIINTARAGLMDENAVLEGIRKKSIAGVALDVFANEPPTDNILIKDKRVIATPHIGGFTVESVSRAVASAVKNLLTYLE